VSAGKFNATAQTRNDAAAQVVDLIATEITRLSSDLVSAAELTPRRATVLGSFSRQLETVSGLSGIIANSSAYGLPMGELSMYAAKVRAVTPEQIRDATMRRLPAAGVSYIVVGDASMFGAALMQKYPTAETIPLTMLNLDSATLRGAAN
jgi:zinc protease